MRKGKFIVDGGRIPDGAGGVTDGDRLPVYSTQPTLSATQRVQTVHNAHVRLQVRGYTKDRGFNKPELLMRAAKLRRSHQQLQVRRFLQKNLPVVRVFP